MTSRIDILQAGIETIGREMVLCRLSCKGVDLAPGDGKIPRALHLEIDGRKGERGIVVVGLNPGRASESERDFYVKNGPTYETFVRYWEKHPESREHPYHKRIRENVTAWGFDGPILWTELAKCQTKPDLRILPLQTFRTCVDNFLSQELDLVPNDWPIVTAGRETYIAVSYLFRK